MSSFSKPPEGAPPAKLEQESNRSPTPPPYSPLTPEPSMPTLDMPPPVPISESSNPDAIALRSALSILQIQRLRSIQDVQRLNRQKELALADPEAFTKALKAGQVRKASQQGFLGTHEDGESSGDDTQSNQPKKALSDESTALDQDFGRVPQAQNVVRCPPINWAKYHVAGDALDSLHEQERRQPTAAEPQQSESATGPHVVAAPYSPWRDRLPTNPPKPRSDRDT
ncbi:MAG: hypothetical protein LQ340_002003 [Diploschistes diacapsis]|nr:MAG: hypothetical protein LQ340_002003 [Diploschistes diacapsis]